MAVYLLRQCRERVLIPTYPSTPIIKEELDIPVQFPQTPADSPTPPVSPSPASAPLPRPRIPAVPPEPPGLRRSTRTKNHLGEWWKVKPLPLPVFEQDSSEDENGDTNTPPPNPDTEAGFDEMQFAGTANVADPCIYTQAMKGSDAEK